MLFDHFEVWEEKEREREIGADVRLTLRTAKCAARGTAYKLYNISHRSYVTRSYYNPSFTRSNK